MTFSRSHAGMLAIVSLFTGMIAPVVGNGERMLPFPLTSLQIVSYITFLLLVVGFFLVSTRRWRLFSLVGILLMGFLGYFTLTTMRGEVFDRTGGIFEEWGWGWIFLFIGGVFLLWTLLWRQVESEENHTSLLFDSILGIVGAFTLLCLSALIVFVSFQGIKKGPKISLLEKNFGTGMLLENASGVVLSRPFVSITALSFERAHDRISFEGLDADGEKKHYPQNTEKATKEPKEGEKVIVSGEYLIAKTSFGEKIYTVQNAPARDIVTADNTNILAWVEPSGTGYIVRKNGEQIGETFHSIENIMLSPSGYDIMVRGKNMANQDVVSKNGGQVGSMLLSKTGAYQSNGSHFITVYKEGDKERVVYDGTPLEKDFEEVREIFLEKSGNSYAFFARPIGEKTYCLFTRYKGNLCGLEGYMNPKLGADGGSLLYAGRKDGIWKIYRNTTSIVEATGYTKTDISHDYFFLDITNPKQYLFIEQQGEGKYILRKNGKIIPGVWKDVGLDVTFGYDDTVIMSLKDSTGWRVAEF